MSSLFVLFSVIFCLNSNFLFCNFLSISFYTKLKRSFGGNSREENKFLNLNYLASPITWRTNVKYVADINQHVFWRLLNYQIFRSTQNNKKASPNEEHWSLSSFILENQGYEHCMKSVQIRSYFWSVFSRIWTEYGEIQSISPYSIRMRENTDQKKTPYSDTCYAMEDYWNINKFCKLYWGYRNELVFQ